jgi:hypothetical protein
MPAGVSGGSYGGGGGGNVYGYDGQTFASEKARDAAARRVSPPTRAGGGSLQQQSYAAYQRGEKGNIPGGLSYDQYVNTYFGGGGGGGAVAPYQPEAPAASGIINTLTETGEGLLDPTSEYSSGLRDEMTRDIGERTDAASRRAQLMAARSGLGTGASPELLETQGDISREGLRAAEGASADLALQSPELGISALSPALSGEIGLQGQRLTGYLAGEELAAEQEGQQADLDLAYDRLSQEALLRELMLGSSFF